MAVGLLYPGEMGAAVGACLVGRGETVLWASRDRGEATARRARDAGLVDVGTPQRVAAEAETVLSVCPPHAAVAVARSMLAGGFTGTYVDANAVSPETSRQIARLVTSAGAGFVDGGIIGAPPRSAGDSRLYLSGDLAGHVAGLFAGTALEARVVSGGTGAASAVKMAYAAWTKGSAALLLTARALARVAGVEDTLLAEWQDSQPDLARRSERAAASATAKGWRWVGEMEEIAASLAAADLPDGFHQAAAQVYRRSPRGTAGDPLAAVLDALPAHPR